MCYPGAIYGRFQRYSETSWDGDMNESGARKMQTCRSAKSTYYIQNWRSEPPWSNVDQACIWITFIRHVDRFCSSIVFIESVLSSTRYSAQLLPFNCSPPSIKADDKESRSSTIMSCPSRPNVSVSHMPRTPCKISNPFSFAMQYTRNYS